MIIDIPDNLIILEMANNHMGDVEHGIRIVREFHSVCKKFPSFTFAFKLQYRHLDTFIHPDFQGRDDIKYIKRFSETKITREEKQRLIKEIRDCGFIAICTPFDERSVDDIVEDDFDIIKIGSCSFTDWPLLERATLADKPMILSTAGAKLADIDAVVGFLYNRNKKFVLMHCIGEYPTMPENMHLNQIDVLKARYPGVRIGYSTHENPNEPMPVVIAVAKGCRIFEKHVGVPFDKYTLNDYSSSPEQFVHWLKAAERAYAMSGVCDVRVEPSIKETETLHSLRRGVFAKADLPAGHVVRLEDVIMAIPTVPDHVTANDWSKYTNYKLKSPVKNGAPILHSNVESECIRERVIDIVMRIQDTLKQGNIVFPKGSKLEISHHYGLDKFYEYGAALITIVNRDYCKKLIVVLPGQKHPNHFHRQKDETLHVLYGTLNVTLEGETKDYVQGDLIVVEPGKNHSFTSTEGAVFEEISSTHYVHDSVYTDETINTNLSRKTLIAFWNGALDLKRVAEASKEAREKASLAK